MLLNKQLYLLNRCLGIVAHSGINYLEVMKMWNSWWVAAFCLYLPWPREWWDTFSGHSGKWMCTLHAWRRWWDATSSGFGGCCLVSLPADLGVGENEGSGRLTPGTQGSVLHPGSGSTAQSGQGIKPGGSCISSMSLGFRGQARCWVAEGGAQP